MYESGPFQAGFFHSSIVLNNEFIWRTDTRDHRLQSLTFGSDLYAYRVLRSTSSSRYFPLSTRIDIDILRTPYM